SLLRVRLLQLAERDHVLLLTMHHIISDGWSVGVLLRELGALYEAYCLGRPNPLAPLPIQYADYGAWQRSPEQAARLEEELGYWQEQLAAMPPLLTLPLDRARPAMQTFSGATQSFRLSPALTQGLKRFSSEQGVTLFMTLASAYALLLSRYARQDDVAI